MIVISLAGHDRGRFYHVLRVEGEYASLADGKLRRLDHPKRKKVKHLKYTAYMPYAGQSEPLATDREIRESLAAFRAGHSYSKRIEPGTRVETSTHAVRIENRGGR